MSTSHALNSWIDLYRALRDAAEATRGVDDPSTLTLEPAGWPRTTGLDALALASLFDPAIRRYAHRSLVERWRIETDRLARETSDTLMGPYSGNRSLWMTLSVAAGTLYQCSAALPAAEASQAVLRELAAETYPTCTISSTRTATAQFPCVPTWEEMAQLQLRFFAVLRGTDLIAGPLLAQIPRTTNADVLQLATYWTEQLAGLGGCEDTAVSRHLRKRWGDAIDDVGRLADDAAPHATYPHNVEFWRALVALALYVGASAGAPASWSLHVDTLHDPDLSPTRNAAPVPLEGAHHVEFPAAATWDEAAQIQKAYFVKLRGSDAVPGAIGTPIPRTTNGDVAQLAAYWTAHLVRVGVHHADDTSYRHLVDRWFAATADVVRLTRGADVTATYARNTEFWAALMTIAIQVAVTDEAPSKWTLITESIGASVHKLPDTLTTAAARIASAFSDTLGAAARKAGLAIAKPLLIAAGGVIGFVVLLRVLREGRSERKPRDGRSVS
jgi:hypothetical protein